MRDDLAMTVSEDQPLQLGQFSLGQTGLTVKGKPTIKEWENVGAFIQHVEGAVQWWIGDWLNYGESAYGEKYSQALEATGIPLRTLENYAFVAGHVTSTRRRVDVGWALHQELASYSAKEQREWLARIVKGDDGVQWSKAHLRTELRLRKRREQYAAGALPDGRFRVVYADPPWKYDDSGVITPAKAKPGHEDGWGRAERHYPTMSIEDLCAMPVRDRLTDDAVLFMWVTSPLLAECWPVIEAWGFTYKTSMIWAKRTPNWGHYVSVCHELLLICTRGSCTPDVPTPMPESVVSERRSATHSEKPESFRQTIDRLYPLGHRLELFGRRDVEGWTVYGNQLLAPPSDR